MDAVGGERGDHGSCGQQPCPQAAERTLTVGAVVGQRRGDDERDPGRGDAPDIAFEGVAPLRRRVVGKVGRLVLEREHDPHLGIAREHLDDLGDPVDVAPDRVGVVERVHHRRGRREHLAQPSPGRLRQGRERHSEVAGQVVRPSRSPRPSR